ncbi:DegV family protein [Domibacillus sp. PGB-M46]|uniref:DegV family protein n=1 Tax=Domibacillus sp. PGB-M46 TaxID=2910255 RepID=UPI001F58BAC8|nr:DegV family protein [Domibacillus sp. PGB-M46]MCI2256554.1 DegV family protein [Domibacillus sp. PGB-M46]
MRRVIFSTESGADLPVHVAQKYGVQIVPMHVIMDGQDYLDGFIPVRDIYDYYARTKKIPSTTSVNSNEYHEFFTKIKSDFPGCVIIHIGYTSRASSSFQNAVTAAGEFDDIFLIDALNVSGGLMAIVMHAVTLLEAEPSVTPSELIEKIESQVPKSRLAFIPGSLDFLRAGGRVSNAAYLSGSLLKIKPLIELVDGKLVSTKKYRGSMSRVTVKMMHDYLNKYNIDKGQLYFLYSIGLDESTKKQMDDIAEEAGFQHVTWIEAGAVISTHGGPGAFGIAGLEI